MANNKYNQTRWQVPSRRAENYAAERRMKVHNRGKKEGKPLTDYESGLRSGYLQCQRDHAGIYKFKEALKAGKNVEEAREISYKKSKKRGA